MPVPYSESPAMCLKIRFRKTNKGRPWAMSTCKAFEANKTVLRIGLDIRFRCIFFASFITNSNENSWFYSTVFLTALPCSHRQAGICHATGRDVMLPVDRRLCPALSPTVSQFFAPRHHLQICDLFPFALALVTDRNSWATNSLEVIMINVEPLITK